MLRRLVIAFLIFDHLRLWIAFLDWLGRGGEPEPPWDRLWHKFCYEVMSGYGPGEIDHWDYTKD